MLSLFLLGTIALAQDDDEDARYDFEGLAAPAELAVRPRLKMSATVGGAQDVSFFRDGVERGQIPHPNTFTPEGLFSEHDLPVEAQACDRLLCAFGSAADASLPAQPEVTTLAQLGFASVLDAGTFERPPLNLVAVVDRSGSMGSRLALVKSSLHQVASHLDEHDQLTIVTFGDGSAVHMATVHGDAPGIGTAIDSIVIAGGTHLEAGLRAGFRAARDSHRAFDGTTRVLLFTDERPNLGNTDETGFMAMARQASQGGIGLTTIGVGVQFGAELATTVSSVRGGNLFYFPDANEMERRFAEDFDTMVVELAYDVDLTVAPPRGHRIAGVYGIPGDAVTWTDDGQLSLHVETLFASKRGGAIYFAFAPEEDWMPARSRPVEGTVTLSYTARDGVARPATVPLALTEDPGIGLTRGMALVDEITTLKSAARLHHESNDQERAYQLVAGLADRLAQSADPALAPERETVSTLLDTLSLLSGHGGESPEHQLDAVSGLPVR